MAVTLLEMEHKEQKGVMSLRLVYAPRAWQEAKYPLLEKDLVSDGDLRDLIF